MPKYNIGKLVVNWKGKGTETIKDVEVIAPFLPSNDQRTKEFLLPMYPGAKLISSVSNVKKV